MNERPRRPSFNERQREFVRAIARGRSIPEAAEELGISVRAAQQVAVLVRAKLGVKNLREVPAAYWRATGDRPYPRDVAELMPPPKRVHQAPPPKPPRRAEPRKRNTDTPERTLAMARMRDQGMTLVEIGQAFGLGRSRVSQILIREAGRRGEPFDRLRTPQRQCANCGEEIAKQNKSEFCRACRPRRPRDWTTRASEEGIFRHYSPSTGEWLSNYYVHDMRDPETHARGKKSKARRFETVEEARAFRAMQAAERPFRTSRTARPSPQQEHVLRLLGSGPLTLKQLAQALGGGSRDYDRARYALHHLSRKGLVERVGWGVYARSS